MVDFEYMIGDGVYNKESERAIIWNDSDIGIEWGVEKPLVSEKDNNAPKFTDIPESDLF